MSEFRPGDVVVLKSGGPAMTVEEVGDYDPIGPSPGLKCIWFEGKEKQTDVFSPHSVELHQPNELSVPIQRA